MKAGTQRQSVTQTYKAGYALYVSHSPEGPVPGDAFDLTVTCKSDMDEFPVALRGEGVDLTQTGSKSDPEVTFSVPANTGAEARELKIFVGGADCGKSVVQQSKYTDVAVGQTTWARGNVVLEGGQFAIGAPTDYGLYFKFNSTYGMPYDPGAAYYQGTAYNPNPVTIGWKDMAADAGGDPCRLVAPADTWRLPTRSEIEALNGTAGDSLTLNGVLGQSYAGGALFVRRRVSFTTIRERDWPSTGGRASSAISGRARESIRCVSRKRYARSIPSGKTTLSQCVA